jgi:hypothetical protein
VRPPSSGRGGTILGSFAAAAAFAVVLGLLLQLRYGYLAGNDDHLVLSLQGLQWARPGFLTGDWFVRSAPQPHLLFDVVTWWGARTGQLSAGYLAWWVLGLVVGGAGTAVLARAWAPRHPVPASAAVAALMALGPTVVLGTTTPALPIALPHELGGFLAYLTGALLLTRRPRAAAVACVATTVVHVQIGVLVAVVCLLAVGAVWCTQRRWWWPAVSGAVVAGAVAATVLRLRPVAADPDDFVEICRDVIPFHCDATTWPAGQLASGFAVLLAALLTVVLLSRADGLLWAAVVLTPAAGLTGGVAANRYGIAVLGRLAQSTNIFRLAVLVLPFGAWGLIAGFARLSRGRRLLWLPPALAAGFGWLEPRGGDAVLAGHSGWVITVLAVAACGVLAAGLPSVPGVVRGVPVAAAAAVLILAVSSAGSVRWRPFRPAFVADPVLRAMGTMIASHVPPGEVVEAPPSYGVIRLTSGRSLVADCKAVPYGGAAWRDYRARMEALGGRGACSHGGAPFTSLPASALISAARRYGAGYLVLPSWDRRVPEAEAAGWRVLAAPTARTGAVWLLAAPGAPDAAG